MSEQIDIELKKEFEKSCFYKKYSVENKYYVECVLKYVFNESIGRVSNCKVDNEDYKSATYSQVVEQNCEVIGHFIESFVKQFFKKYKSDKIKDYKEVIIEMIEEVYLDPDDKFDYDKIKEKEFGNIEFSYDGLISIKSILEFSEGILLDGNKSIEEYKDCRNIPIFFFPSRQKNRAQTINQSRNLYFKDRIDYFLFDIKNYLDGKESKMKEIYENGDTKDWLKIVKDKGGFEYLVNLYDINDIFVVKRGEEYKILDIEKNDGQSFIEKYREEKNYNWTSDYYINLKSLISKYNGRLK